MASASFAGVSVAFTGGGTGGHIYPGLAVAAALRERLSGSGGGPPVRLFWIGSTTGMDRAIVSGAGLEFFGIPSGKLRRYFSLENFKDLFKVAAGFFAARRILKREKPALLFSKGGFVSVPPCAAAASLGIPLFTHESDFSPGLATRINARFAEKIFVPYEETRLFFTGDSRRKALVSGNPLRAAFRGADPAKGRAFLGLEEGERILLVLGGSTGAREINELVRESLGELTKYYTVVHQTGAASEGEYQSGERYRVLPYIKEELPHVLAAAELVVCRCGAGTLWECASLGRPMVMIPLSGSATRGDQVENARFFERSGMGTGLRGTGGGAEQLAATVAALALDAGERAAMSAASAGVAALDAAAFIAGELASRIQEAP